MRAMRLLEYMHMQTCNMHMHMHTCTHTSVLRSSAQHVSRASLMHIFRTLQTMLCQAKDPSLAAHDADDDGEI